MTSENILASVRPGMSLCDKSGSKFPRSGHGDENKVVYKKHSSAKRFRLHQERKWQKHFADLVQFKSLHNHTHVPYTHSDNPALARWVKRQRYQYYLFRQGKPSCMTEDRVNLLHGIGFVWESHETVYQERIQELIDFKREKGHCVVPARHPQNAKLATWVKCQRRQYKLYWEGRPSNMTIERILTLENLGFKWNCQKEPLSKSGVMMLDTVTKNCPKPVPEKATSGTARPLNEKLNQSTKDVNEWNPSREGELPLPAYENARDYRLFMEVLSDLSSDSEDDDSAY